MKHTLIVIVALLAFTSAAEAYMHPKMGRFIQRDPLGYVDGMSLVQYVRSAPVRAVDPGGQYTCSNATLPRAPAQPLDTGGFVLIGSGVVSVTNSVKTNAPVRIRTSCGHVVVKLSADASLTANGANWPYLPNTKRMGIGIQFTYTQTLTGTGRCNSFRWAQWFKDSSFFSLPAFGNWRPDPSGRPFCGWYDDVPAGTIARPTPSLEDHPGTEGGPFGEDSATFVAELISLGPDNCKDTVVLEIRWEHSLFKAGKSSGSPAYGGNGTRYGWTASGDFQVYNPSSPGVCCSQ